MSHALVLFSGGQDSTTCLLYALQTFDRVFTIGFSYQQRHAVELTCRKDILHELPALASWRGQLCDDIVVEMPNFSDLDANALTSSAPITSGDGLPSTFVPARNLIFLTYAAAYAYRKSVTTLICGVGETDYSGYPDCRENTMRSMEESLSLGLDTKMTISTPLMHLSKAQTWDLARQLGGEAAIELIRHKTHTCYRDDHSTWHEYGYGCGTCPSCLLRKKGYEEFLRGSYKSVKMP